MQEKEKQLKEPFAPEFEYDEPEIFELQKSVIAIVDASDKKNLSKYNWRFDGRYAVTDVWNKSKKKSTKVYMHKIILTDNQEVDHINRNKLDNRKSNLRYVTRSENNLNQPVRKDNTSGHKGVSYSKTKGRWVAYITIKKSTKKLGSYSNKLLAINARKKAEESYGL